MAQIVTAIILFVIAAGAYTVSILSFFEKGPLFNNAYLYASKHQRKTMNKKPHYRQTAVVFLLIGTVFLSSGLGALLRAEWIFGIAIIFLIALFAYAIVSSIKSGK